MLNNAVKALYASNDCYLSLQGKLTDGFHIGRGVRQGCPLSPLLFVIVMSVLIADSQEKLVSLIGDQASKFSEILFADDTFILDEDGSFAALYTYIRIWNASDKRDSTTASSLIGVS